MNQGQYIKETVEKLQELKVVLEAGLPITSGDLTDIKTNTADTVNNTAILADCVNQIIDQVKVDIKTINDTTIESGSGNLSAGVQRVCIASDDVNLSEVYSCIDHVNHHVEVDLNAFNGVTSATNQGFLSNGTLRVAIATDDINIANMNTEITKIGTVVDEATDCVHIDLKTLKGITLENNQGYLSNGVPRVCIAQDDINVARLTGNSSGDMNAFNVNLRGIRFGAGDVDITSANGNVTSGTIRVTVADNDTNLAAINSNIVTLNTTLTNIYTILNDIWNDGSNYIRTHETP